MNYREVELPSNRKFGFFFFIVFFVLGVYFWKEELVIFSYILFGLAILFFAVTLIKPNFLLPLNKFWMKLGLLIGMIVSPIVLGVIFFGLFTPISLFMKLFGRDELRLKLKGRHSHWKVRKVGLAHLDSFKSQF